MVTLTPEEEILAQFSTPGLRKNHLEDPQNAPTDAKIITGDPANATDAPTTAERLTARSERLWQDKQYCHALACGS
jgi:hypothetical protein